VVLNTFHFHCSNAQLSLEHIWPLCVLVFETLIPNTMFRELLSSSEESLPHHLSPCLFPTAVCPLLQALSVQVYISPTLSDSCISFTLHFLVSGREEVLGKCFSKQSSIGNKNKPNLLRNWHWLNLTSFIQDWLCPLRCVMWIVAGFKIWGNSGRLQSHQKNTATFNSSLMVLPDQYEVHTYMLPPTFPSLLR
jgi:hypothetical protein